jgi:hypothetical protein
MQCERTRIALKQNSRQRVGRSEFEISLSKEGKGGIIPATRGSPEPSWHSEIDRV